MSEEKKENEEPKEDPSILLSPDSQIATLITRIYTERQIRKVKALELEDTDQETILEILKSTHQNYLTLLSGMEDGSRLIKELTKSLELRTFAIVILASALVASLTLQFG